MRLIPLRGCIIVKYDDPPSETKSGLLLADPDYRPLPDTGTVYAVGNGVKAVSPGDRIFFRENSPKGFKVNEEAMLRITEEQVLGVFEGGV